MASAGLYPAGNDAVNAAISKDYVICRNSDAIAAKRPRDARRPVVRVQIEAEPAARFRQHRRRRGEVHRVLAPVAGGASAVPASTLLGASPWIDALAPLVIQPAHSVGVAIGEDGGARWAHHPLRYQDGSGAGLRVGVACGVIVDVLQPQEDRRVEVAVHIGFVARVLRDAVDRNQFGQPISEATTVEGPWRPSCSAFTRPYSSTSQYRSLAIQGHWHAPLRRNHICPGRAPIYETNRQLCQFG